eukprot:TRINITY_DN8022_c0_g1_i1.p2 TRINITY_DN8022_c0_g1~~TRINITY_DN8022_c0_g1_i1.p2  ORF type:complete len:100 (+),score=3.71 TRINITY_DN8022_c0_g1_i1:1110-1409(+)
MDAVQNLMLDHRQLLRSLLNLREYYSINDNVPGTFGYGIYQLTGPFQLEPYAWSHMCRGKFVLSFLPGAVGLKCSANLIRSRLLPYVADAQGRNAYDDA